MMSPLFDDLKCFFSYVFTKKKFQQKYLSSKDGTIDQADYENFQKGIAIVNRRACNSAILGMIIMGLAYFTKKLVVAAIIDIYIFAGIRTISGILGTLFLAMVVLCNPGWTIQTIGGNTPTEKVCKGEMEFLLLAGTYFCVFSFL